MNPMRGLAVSVMICGPLLLRPALRLAGEPGVFLGLERPLRHAVEDFDDVLEGGVGDALRDEDDACPGVGRGPAVQPRHGVEKMLRALDDSRAGFFTLNADEAFDAQKARPEILGDAIKEELQFFTRQGIGTREDEALDALALEMEWNVLRSGAILTLSGGAIGFVTLQAQPSPCMKTI